MPELVIQTCEDSNYTAELNANVQISVQIIDNCLHMPIMGQYGAAPCCYASAVKVMTSSALHR